MRFYDWALELSLLLYSTALPYRTVGEASNYQNHLMYVELNLSFWKTKFTINDVHASFVHSFYSLILAGVSFFLNMVLYCSSERSQE